MSTLLLYIIPLQLHVGINIIWLSQKLPKYNLTTEPLNLKWNKDMHLTDVTCTVNREHEIRLDPSRYIFSQLSSPPRGSESL